MNYKDYNEYARKIVLRACKRERSYKRISFLYGLNRVLIDAYINGEDCGPLTARQVIRVELGRLQAEKEGRDFVPTNKDRYKGTREY